MMNRENYTKMIVEDDEILQYDGGDEERIGDVAEAVTDSSVIFLQKLAAFRDATLAEASEESAYDMKIARQELVSAWSYLQLTTSAAAVVLRIDGESVYNQTIQAMDANEEFIPEGY